MKRRSLFTLAGGGVAAFLVGKYGLPQPMRRYTADTVRVFYYGQEIEGAAVGTLAKWEPVPRLSGKHLRDFGVFVPLSSGYEGES